MSDTYQRNLPEAEAKALIVSTVESLQGCKATELAAIPEIALGVGQRLPLFIQELVNEGSLVGVEYTLLSMPYRLKCFLLPKGTELS